MPWSSISRFSDPGACQQAIQGAAGLEILPTTSGKFDTEITKVRFDQLWMQRFHSSLPQVIACAHPADRQAIAFLTEPKSPKLFYCGRELLPGDIVVSRPDMMHKRFDADLRKGAMSLPKEKLRSTFRSVTGHEFPDERGMRMIRPDSESMSQLLKLHGVVGQLARDTPDILEMAEVGRALEQQLIHFMVRCLASETIATSIDGFRHGATMIKFEEFLETHPDRPLYLTEICSAIGVAERTLRASCEEHLGMGPIRYLTVRRMHLVRRALMRAEPSETTVTRVVTDHGFWELGRFAVAYRTMFGESPSETLRRPSQNLAIGTDRPSSLAAAM